MSEYSLDAHGAVIRASDGATIPADPDNRDYAHYLAWVAAGNTADPYAKPLAEAQSEKCAEIDAKVEALKAGGVPYEGKMLQIDPASRQNISDKAQRARASLDGKATWPAGFAWNMADNTALPLDAAGMWAMALAADDQVTAWVLNGIQHKAAVRALTDAAAVAAYDFSGGW